MSTLQELESQQRQLAVDQENMAQRQRRLADQIKQVNSGPWEPDSSGDWGFFSTGVEKVGYAPSKCIVKASARHQTAKEAESHYAHRTFFSRLYRLAQECNAKHAPLGRSRYYVYLDTDKSYWIKGGNTQYLGAQHLFTSRESAQAACEIMNRDHWTLPTNES